MRLAKFLAESGVASRRAAEEIIRAGRVTVGGEVVTDPARGVDASAAVGGGRGPALVQVDGRAVGPGRAELVVFALNKPRGVVSTASDPQRRRTVVELVPAPAPARLYPVGRLDADSTGLILLTNDGDLAHRLTHPSFEVEKSYRVVVDRAPVSARALRSLRAGVVLDDGLTAPARVRRLAPDTLEITIHEGRKRQIKRMCAKLGHRVVELERVRFGPLELGDLAAGSHRRLSEAEVAALRAAGSGLRAAGSERRRAATRPGASPAGSGPGRRGGGERRPGAGS